MVHLQENKLFAQHLWVNDFMILTEVHNDISPMSMAVKMN